MRYLLVFLVAAVSAVPLVSSPASAKAPTCAINDRDGPSASTRRLPNAGDFRSSLAVGTEVEVVTAAVARDGYPWFLVREPGQVETNYGWTLWRLVTCR